MIAASIFADNRRLDMRPRKLPVRRAGACAHKAPVEVAVLHGASLGVPSLKVSTRFGLRRDCRAVIASELMKAWTPIAVRSADDFTAIISILTPVTKVDAFTACCAKRPTACPMGLPGIGFVDLSLKLGLTRKVRCHPQRCRPRLSCMAPHG